MIDKTEQSPDKSSPDDFWPFLKQRWLVIDRSGSNYADKGFSIGFKLCCYALIPIVGVLIIGPLFAVIGYILGLVAGFIGVLFEYQQMNEVVKLPLAELPADVLQVVAKHLPTRDLKSLICSNTLFKEKLQPDVYLRQFLEAVAHGDQDQAERSLRKNLHLLVQRGSVRDYSGREFPNISGFEYMLGSLDTRYMRDMMLTCVREDNILSIQEKKNLLQNLWNQLKYTQTQGFTYVLNKKTYIQKNDFIFEPIREVMEKLINEYFDLKEYHQFASPLDLYLITIGRAQCLFPAHMAQHYCEPGVPFDPRPNFKSETFNRSLTVYDGDKKSHWWFRRYRFRGSVMVVKGSQNEAEFFDGRDERDPSYFINEFIENTLELLFTRRDDRKAIPQLLNDIHLELNQQELNQLEAISPMTSL